jgi:hypothetical protein
MTVPTRLRLNSGGVAAGRAGRVVVSLATGDALDHREEWERRR